MSEKPSKNKIYHDIISQKEYLTVLKDNDYNFEIPKKAFDRICKFYGKLTLNPISFVTFTKKSQFTEIKKMSSVSHVLGEKEIGNILDVSNCFVVIPKFYHDTYNEATIGEISPKLKNKAMKDIIEKAGMQWDLMIDYVELQIISREEQETMKKTITYEIVQNVFRYIPILNVVIFSREKIDFTFYSYKKILEKSGIKLENMIPYLKHEIKDIDRTELTHEVIPLYEKVKFREIKEKITKSNLKDQNIDIYLGAESLPRFNKSSFDMVEKDGNEASNLLNDLIQKVNDKKDKINSYCENIDNQIIEIKNIDNKIIYIRKIILDQIISDEEPDFDIYKTNDIFDNEVLLSKKMLKEFQDSPSLVKIYNKNNPEEEFIYIEENEIKENLKNFTYVRQEEIFKGINKDDEEIEAEWIVMNIECDNFPKLDESKVLFTIPDKEKAFLDLKNKLLDTLKKENKDIIIYNKNNNYISYNTIKNLKERDKKIKNKNIKYKIKNIIKKNETIIMEYKDIFDDNDSTEFILISNKDKPDDNIIVKKDELIKKLNNWDNINDNIIIKNEIDNNEIHVNPQKIIIIILEKDEIPNNFEDIQEEIKKSITPENTIIKSNNSLIKKTVAEKIITNNDPEYDIYYINDINKKKIKISKKQIEKDKEDPSLQFISISTKEEPDKDIIILTKELIYQLELDPTEETISINDKDGNKYIMKKTSMKINPLEIEDINFDEQPNKIKNNIIKDIKDYYYLYKDPENKDHYIRGDTLNLVKNYKSKYPIENFEIEDNKENKIIIPKKKALKIIDNPDEKKYISLDDEESGGESVMIDFEMIKKGEGDIDELLNINKDLKKITLKKTKITKLKEINSLGEQPEEKQYEIIYKFIEILKKENPKTDINKVKDNKNNDVFIYEDTINKIEENKADLGKTTYKCNSPNKEEIICGKKIIKSSPNKYIKLVEPNIIIEKNELEKFLNQYKPIQKQLKIKDINGKEIEVDPLKLKIYQPSSEETDIIKILPSDFSDINEKLLFEINPQNKLIILNDINNQPIIIKKIEGDNIIKYPKTTFDTFALYDKDGKKIKTSRKSIERNVNDNNSEYVEILDNTNNENGNEIVLVNDLLKALKDKENEEFETKNKDGKKIKLNKKKIAIVKQNNKFIEIPEQGEEIKNKLISEIKDSFIQIKDSKTTKDIILRNSQLIEINNHKQRAPFINYEVLNHKKEKVYTTKDICKKELSLPKIKKLILCYDNEKKENEFLIPLENIENAKLDGDDLFNIGNNKKIPFKNIRVKKLEESQKLGVQPEEEKMIKVYNLINKINDGPLNKSYKTEDIDGKSCFVSNNYINKFQNDTKNDENDTKYKINDAFGKNKITLNKGIIIKDTKPGDYVLIKNKKDTKEYLVYLRDLLNNLNKFKSTDDEISLINSLDNISIKLNPLDIDIIPPFNNYPIQKIFSKKIIPIKNEDNKEENLKINNEKEKNENEKRRVKKNDIDNKDEIKERIRLRSAPARHHIPEKKSYKIRRAIIYKRQKKDNY